jgi:hypothetical protein
MPVRYCASYPTLKVHTEVDHGDWLNPEADSSDMETHPPSYEEAIKEQTDAFVDVELMTPSVCIPMTDFKSSKFQIHRLHSIVYLTFRKTRGMCWPWMMK